MNTAIIMDMMFNTEMIVKDMKGGKEDMTEKRFEMIITSADGSFHYLDKNTGEKITSTLELENKLNELNNENEQLKKDATTLIYANQDYRQQNQNLQEQLDYIQNLISEHIRHQKTELGVKALQEIIVDYNEWILGHKEAKK